MPTGKASRDLQVVDTVLTNVARQFKPQGFIYNEVCPTINVATISGLYPVFDERYFFSNVDSNKLSDRAETPELEFSWSTDSYLCEDFGFKISLTPRERQQANAALRLEASKVQFLMIQMANQREKRLATLLQDSGTAGGALTGGTANAAGSTWDASTTIESEIKAAKLAVYKKTGITPNTMILPYKAAYHMATNATLRDIFKYTVNGAAQSIIRLDGPNGEEIGLPAWFHGLRILVPKGTLQQTGHEGATKSLTEVWGTSARILYVDPLADWGIPSTVYQFQHPVVTGNASAGDGPVVDRWSENDPRKDLIRAVECVDEKVCAGDLGYELKLVTAAL